MYGCITLPKGLQADLGDSCKRGVFLFSIIISLLPLCVTFVLTIGQTLIVEDTNAWITDLQLTQAQIEQIKAIENQYSSQTNSFDQELQQIEISLTQLIIGTASTDQLKQKERELEALKIDAAQVYFEKFLAIREVLTPAQLLKLCEPFTLIMEQRMERFHHRDGEGD